MSCFGCSVIRANRHHGCSGAGGAFCHFTFLRARHLHGGKRRVLEQLSRQVMLEQAMRQSVEQRAATSPQSTLSSYGNVISPNVYETSINLQSTPMHNRAEHSGTYSNKSSPSQESASEATEPHATLLSSEPECHKRNALELTMPIRSLSDFFAQCKQFHCRIGLARNEVARRREREMLRHFWMQHVGSAVQCCAKRGRDFGFVAANGLSDSQLHIPFNSMALALRVMRDEASVCSARDMMMSLHYLARELHWWQKAINGTELQTHSMVELHQDSFQPLPTRFTLDRFRSELIDLTFDRIVFFFITHVSPSSTSSSTRTTNLSSSPLSSPSLCCTMNNNNIHSNNSWERLTKEEVYSTSTANDEVGNGRDEAIASGSSVMSGLIADADDALNALEALSHIHLRHASAETVYKLTEIVATSSAHRKYFANMSSSLSGNYKHNRNDNRYRTNNTNLSSVISSSPNNGVQITLTQRSFVLILFKFVVMQRRQLKMTSLVQAFALLRIFWSELESYNKGSNDAQREMQIRKELHYICWGLALSLRKHDARFVNPYHFVKIIVTLEKLPYWLLSPTPAQNLESKVVSWDRDGSNNDNKTWVDTPNLEREHLTSFQSFMLPHSWNDNSKENKFIDCSDNSVLARGSVWEAAAGTENTQESDYKTGYKQSNKSSENNNVDSTHETSFIFPQEPVLRQQGKSKSATLSPEEFWQYIISKACIFVPMLTSEERKMVYYKLHRCIITKRGSLLGSNSKQKIPNVKMMVTQKDHNLNGNVETASPFAPLTMISSWDSIYSNYHHQHRHPHEQQQHEQQELQEEREQQGNNYNSTTTTTIITSLSDSAEDILLPLTEEMHNLNEDTNAIVSGHQTR